MSRRRVLTVFLVLLVVPLARAGIIEVSLELPMKPRLQIDPDDQLAIAPFVVAASAREIGDARVSSFSESKCS